MTSSRYAAQTEVSSDRSRAEIEHTLKRYGATGFIYGWMGTSAAVGFTMKNRQIKFLLPMPDVDSKEFRLTPTGRTRRNQDHVEEAYEQAVRQRWRALSLAIKAKLEAVESGIATFETEFMAQIVLPNGKTMGDVYIPQIDHAYKNNTMPPLLMQL